MSTRGAWGFRINNCDKVTYNHSDSYLSYLGKIILEFVKVTPTDELNAIADHITLVNEGTPPTLIQIHNCKEFASTKVSGGKLTEWYCLLHRAQQNPTAYAEGLPYMVDGQDFLLDSVFCEWVYIINCDTQKLEIYCGFNRDKNAPGRYASKHEKWEKGQEHFYGVKLVRELSFDEVRNISNVEEYCANMESQTEAA